MVTALDFWRDKKDQHFYVVYCIFATALQSHVHGLTTEDAPEWKFISHYYSTVHSLRLPLLAFLGDYPTNHNNLSKLYLGEPIGWRNQSWFKKTINPVHNSGNLSRSHYIDKLGPSCDSRWSYAWGNILKSFSKARNSLNYEGLIIAHRANQPYVSHTLVSQVVSDLSVLAEQISSRALKEVCEIFVHFVHGCDRGRRRSYHNWKENDFSDKFEGVVYLKHLLKPIDAPQLGNKLSELESLIDNLRGTRYYRKHLAQEVYDNIGPSSFHPKNDLFDKFKGELLDLGRNFQSYIDNS